MFFLHLLLLHLVNFAKILKKRQFLQEQSEQTSLGFELPLLQLALHSFLPRADCQRYLPAPPQPSPALMLATLADLSFQPTRLPLKLGELQLQLLLLLPLPVPSQFVLNLSNCWAVAIFLVFSSSTFFFLLSFTFTLGAVCADKSFRPAYDLNQNRLLLSCVSNWQSSAALQPRCCCCYCLWWPTGMCFKLSFRISHSFCLCLCNPATHRFWSSILVAIENSL